MLAAAVLRAIELRRPVLRSTTTGVTAAIAANGRVVARLGGSSADYLLIDVVPAKEASGFSRFGHLPLMVVVGSLLVARASRIAMADTKK
jgi:apolipoprotein N-acyltransferase